VSLAPKTYRIIEEIEYVFILSSFFGRRPPYVGTKIPSQHNPKIKIVVPRMSGVEK